MTKKETKFIQRYLEYYSKYGNNIPTEVWNDLKKYGENLGIDYQRSKILIEEVMGPYENSNEDKHSDAKSRTRKAYNEISAQLRAAIKQIADISDSTQEFKDIQQSFVNTLSAQLDNTVREANVTLDSTEWDKLVIAFFGETNAGKSTIIETFRILFDKTEREKDIHASFFRRLKNAYHDLPREGHSRTYEIFLECIKLLDIRKWFRKQNYAVDGTIVGDGRHDFTKVYKEYEMTISGRPFILIDVPGIEGNEEDYKEEIKTALGKSHCVFYVQGHNKTTDNATAEKIKKYLRNWVKVYTIYNVRGSADAYDTQEERTSLVNDNVRKVAQEIENTFSGILGDNYGGNTITQGLLALSSQADFSPKREDLIRKQKKLFAFFESRDEMYRFSRFEDVVNLVNEKSSNYTNEIFKANKDKLTSLSHNTILLLDKELDNQKGKIENYRNILSTYQKEVASHYNTSSHAIEIQLKDRCDTEFHKLKESVFEIIKNNDKEKEKRIKNAINATVTNLRRGITQILTQNTEILNGRIKDSRRKLEGIPVNLMNMEHLANESPKICISTDDILENLNISFKDILNFGLSVWGGVAAGSFFGPVGAVIGGVVGGLANWLFSDGGVGKAQEKARKEIDAASVSTWNEIHEKIIVKIKNYFNEQSKNTSAVVSYALTNISMLDNAVNETKKRILNFENKIKSESYGDF